MGEVKIAASNVSYASYTGAVSISGPLISSML